MARVKSMPKYVNRIRGRDGVNRYYYRRPGRQAIRLPDLASAEFPAAYAAAEAGAKPIVIGADRAAAGTIAATVSTYLGSAEFAGLAAETRRTRRNILERLRERHGDKRVAKIEQKHIKAMVAAKAATPSAARNLLQVLRVLMAFAIENGIRTDDPTTGVKHAEIKTDGYETWSEEDIAAFEARHPMGTKPRLALALLLRTGQRRGDIVRMGRQHVKGDRIRVKQSKTGVELMIPMGADLRAAIEATPSDHLTFLITEWGKPFTAPGFTNWFRDRCNQAGLRKGLSAHGLRKAMCRRLAEAGCTAHQIMAISGHVTLKEVEVYTKAADQERMARAAIEKLTESLA
jgi:site-specific recombinase XerD